MKRMAQGNPLFISLVLLLLLAGCQRGTDATGAAATPGHLPRVLAVESFLADIAQNVAGDRLSVATLMPLGLDPHAYEPAPQDVARVADADVLIVNGAGFEEWLAELLANAGGERLVIEASKGLTPRSPQADEEAAHDGEAHADETHADESHDHAVDPHFWLDPTQAAHYVETIRDGLNSVDPEGAATYAANAEAYIAELNELDAWIRAQIEQIPAERRLLVTNHESLGYFADRYGLRIVGAVTPSSSSSASPSAQQLAALADLIRSSAAPAIFLETGASPQLAEQLHDETGITVVTGLLTHSLTPADGGAPTYLDMMRYNTQTIVDALR
jgi:ABC-type Zn uptake system ZnuABC Zn-binding protein ZnuA